MREGWIYALLEHNSNEIRYVGQTRALAGVSKRIDKHVHRARRAVDNTHLSNWLRRLESRPRYQILATLPVEQLNAAEIAWIAYLRELGCDLTNTTPGGTGGPVRKGMRTPPEVNAKQQLKRIGRRHDPATIERMKARYAESLKYLVSCRSCRRIFGGSRALATHKRYCP